MATNVLSQLTEELSLLEQELADFKTAVGYLKGAKDHVKTAVEAVNKAENYHLTNLATIEKAYAGLDKVVATIDNLNNKIETVDFPARLTSIETNLTQVVKSIDEATKTTLVQLQKASESITKADFDTKFSRLDSVVNTSITSARKAVDDTHKLSTAQVVKLEKSIEALESSQIKISKDQMVFFNNLNLHNRFEKLDTTITAIITTVQGIQGRLDLIERNIKDKIAEVQEQSRRELEKSVQYLQAEIKKQGNKSQTNAYIIMVLTVIIGICAIILGNHK
ncbi:hypothetical protein V9K67_22320 [Paraflavisolibacter sp. H34]|uniref:hypothetical protein n=1 Tax=Huijunlia imazamoxiresistens TaxID=3127457 RepID=UPI0030183528